MFGLQIVLARELGAQAFGLYSFGFALLLLLLIPAKFGLDQSVFRFTSERLGLADPRGAHQYVRTAIVHTLGVSTAIALLWCRVRSRAGWGSSEAARSTSYSSPPAFRASPSSG